MPPPAPTALRIVVKPDGATIEDVYAAAGAAALARGGASAASSSSSGGGGGGGGGGGATPARAGAGAAHVAPERLALTPRSAEACLMEGVDPKDLFNKTLESFGGGDHGGGHGGHALDPAIVRMVRHAALRSTADWRAMTEHGATVASRRGAARRVALRRSIVCALLLCSPIACV